MPGPLIKNAKKWEKAKRRQKRRTKKTGLAVFRFVEIVVVSIALLGALGTATNLMVVATVVALVFTCVGLALGALIWRQ